jgi:glycosyltransferase involved in cell wall biosynthesis
MRTDASENIRPPGESYPGERTKPIHVLQILGDPVGGIRKHVHGVILGLSPRSYLSSYAHGSNPDGSFAGEIDTIREHTLKTLALTVRKRPRPSDLRNLAVLARYIRASGVEIVHGHGAKGGVYARVVSRLCGIKSIYTPHGGSVHPMFSPAENLLYQITEKALLPLTDILLFESRYSAQTYRERVGKEPRRWIVNHNGVSIPDEKAIARRAQELAYRSRFQGTFQVGILGTLRHQKGQAFGIQAVGELVRDGVPLMLHVYGDGPDRDTLEQLSRDVGLGERVHFHGHVTDTAAHMYCLDLVVVPSRFESFGYVAVEAMSLHKPVIAAGVGGLLEIIENGRTGLLVEPGNVEQLKSAIGFCFDNEQARVQFADLGYQRFRQEFTYDQMMGNICHVYRELAGR